jgi:hypothetical protein
LACRCSAASVTEPKRDMDERVVLPLDPEEALRALLAVKIEKQDPDHDSGDDKPGQLDHSG